MPQQSFACIKIKSGVDRPTAQHTRKPHRIILPHCIQWNVINSKPLRPHLLCFARFASHGSRDEDVTLRIPIRLSFKHEFNDTARLKRRDNDPRLFHCLAPTCVFDGFSGLDLSARSIPFSSAKAPLFHGQENAPVNNRITERGAFHANTVSPCFEKRNTVHSPCPSWKSRHSDMDA